MICQVVQLHSHGAIAKVRLVELRLGLVGECCVGGPDERPEEADGVGDVLLRHRPPVPHDGVHDGPCYDYTSEL